MLRSVQLTYTQIWVYESDSQLLRILEFTHDERLLHRVHSRVGQVNVPDDYRQNATSYVSLEMTSIRSISGLEQLCA